MPNRCVAYGCNNSSSEEGISTFHFPKEAKLRKQWINQVKRTMTAWTGPSDHSVICSEHFSSECFENKDRLYKDFGLSLKKELKEGAVPTIF